jgi:riboflavin kinase / FMN adenylyltransferase
VPADGIYAVRVRHEHQYFGGMLYIGYRPTVGGTLKNIEVNIFDFDEEIYGETLTVEFISLLRNDTKFRDLETLKKQLEEDKQAALRVLH